MFIPTYTYIRDSRVLSAKADDRQCAVSRTILPTTDKSVGMFEV